MTFRFGKEIFWMLVGVVTITMSSTYVQAAAYQDAVLALNPSYYYELNETDPSGGIVDSIGNASPGFLNGDYVNGPAEIGVPGPDFLLFEGAWSDAGWDPDLVGIQIPITGLGEENTAHASNNNGHINLGEGDLYGAPGMSVAMFVRGGGNAQGGDRLFTNNLGDPTRSFQINVGNNGLVVSFDPTQERCNGLPDEDCAHRTLKFPGQGDETGSGAGGDAGFISPDNGWWHLVASTAGGDTALERAGNLRLWLNGVDRTEDMRAGTDGWGINTELAKIGGRRENPTDSTTHSGAQDEVAIWLGTALTDDDALSLFNAAVGVAPTPDCDFDNNGVCDVNDLNDLLYIGQANNDPLYDLDGSGTVDLDDRDVWLSEPQVNSFPGDFDLNGQVVAGDLNALGGNWRRDDLTSWAQGDADGDGDADSADLNDLGKNWQAGVAAAASTTAAVPEPTGIMLSMLGLLGLFAAHRRR